MFRRLPAVLAAAILATVLMPAAAPASAGSIYLPEGRPQIPGFQALDVLYDPRGFPIEGVARPETRYAAFGLLGDRVAVTTSPDGVTWSAPAAGRIRDSRGDQPFLIGAAARLAVAYVGVAEAEIRNQFVVVYTPVGANPREVEPADFFGYTHAGALHVATSPNGIEWVNDGTALNDPHEPIVDGAGSGSFKEGILGPTDLIMNPGEDCPDSAAIDLDWFSASPFQCRFTLTYTAVGAGGAPSVVIAGGDYFTGFGWQFRAEDAPALTRSSTAWTSAGIDRAHVLVRGGVVEMAFSGSTTHASCTVVAAACSAGTARSSNGVTFVPDRLSEPSLPNQVAASHAGQPVSVHDLQPLADSTEPSYLVGFGGATWRAASSASIGPEPRLTFVKPVSGYLSAAEPDITFVLNDDAGVNPPGIDLANLDIRLDGQRLVSGWDAKPTGIGSVTTPGMLVTIPSNRLASLEDGLHTVAVTARDTDGLTVTGSRTILVDRVAPGTVATSARHTGFTAPLFGGSMRGEFHDVGIATGLKYLRGTIVNPLGERRSCIEGPGETGEVSCGFSFSSLTDPAPNGGFRRGSWLWAFPTSNPDKPADVLFWSVPGSYTFEVTGIDFAGNAEAAGAGNSRTFLVL